MCVGRWEEEGVSGRRVKACGRQGGDNMKGDYVLEGKGV